MGEGRAGDQINQESSKESAKPQVTETGGKNTGQEKQSNQGEHFLLRPFKSDGERSGKETNLRSLRDGSKLVDIFRKKTAERQSGESVQIESVGEGSPVNDNPSPQKYDGEPTDIFSGSKGAQQGGSTIENAAIPDIVRKVLGTDRQQDKPTRTEQGDKSTRATQDKLSYREKMERGRLGKPEDIKQNYIGFRFGSAEVLPDEMDRMLAGSGLPADLSTVDSSIGIHITSYASRPGSESHNLRLSEERGQSLKKEFRARGFRGSITIEARGESDAQKANESHIESQSDRDSYDQQDDARFRIALIEILDSSGEGTKSCDLKHKLAKYKA